MEKSGNIHQITTNKPESSFQLLSPEVTVNQIFHPHPNRDRFLPRCYMDADYFCQESPCGVGQVNQTFHLPACVVPNKEPMQRRDPDGRGATPARMSLHRQHPDGCYPHPVETRRADMIGECCYWRCGASGGTTRGEDECNLQLQSDEEHLEAPLPLRSDDEWQHYNPFAPPHCYMYNYGEGQYNFDPVNKNPPQRCHHSALCQHRRPWDEAPKCLAQGSVSVNMPQFIIPPMESMSQVSVMNLSSAGGEACVSHPHEKRRAISLPEECRNVFITYSSDVSSEIVAFTDYLRKQGFRPAIYTDVFDNPRCMDINKRMDGYLKDPSTLIVIAISPQYKADIEGSAVDSHGLHTKYFHTMMQNEFILQGSLNFRFIPVLFLNASLNHVPSWLQNTRVHRWPWDTEDLLLRLLREERYAPPPVPVELTLIIRPVPTSSAAPL